MIFTVQKMLFSDQKRFILNNDEKIALIELNALVDL